jgi:dTDP-4-dehydrorhamnose reductase
VTLWSAFGNVDWRSLLTERRGIYDPGAFDIRGETVRPTAVAKAARAFANGEEYDHPALDSPGWWRRPPRLYAWNGRCQPMDWGGRKLLITGATGTLGNAFARLCEERALPFCLTSRDELDICDPASIAAAIERHRPWAVINAAGFVRVADATRERDACIAWNADGPANLAQACSAAGIKLVTFSSDLVFDGRRGRPYREDDPLSPREPYGDSKAAAERRVRAAMPDALVVRTSAFFGPWDRYNFAWRVASALAAGEAVRADRRAVVSPTYVPDLAHVVLDLLVDGESGLWHLANQGAASWFDFARAIAAACGLDPDLVEAEDGPRDTSNALESRHGALLRPLGEAIADFARDIGPALQREARIAAE